MPFYGTVPDTVSVSEFNTKGWISMIEEKMRELIRRLNAEGYRTEPAENGAICVYGRNGASVSIESNDDIFYKRQNVRLANKVRDIRDQVDEYMTAFLNAAPGVEKYLNGQGDTRTLLLYNRCELAARQFSNGGMEFVTWRFDANGYRETGNYWDEYTRAKSDFAIRAGLIDMERLLTEKELAIIRSNLSDYISFETQSDDHAWQNENDVKSVVNKINRLIGPEIQNQEDEMEEFAYEPEQDL